MALGKYTRVEGRRSSSSYCLSVTLVVFVALCLAGVWMITSSSVVPVQKVDTSSEDNKNGPREEVIENNDNKTQLEDSPGDLAKDSATKRDNSMSVSESENKSGDVGETEINSENSIESSKDEDKEMKGADENVNIGNKDVDQQNKSMHEDVDKGNDSEDASKSEMDTVETKSGGQLESMGDSNESGGKSDFDENGKNSSETMDDVKEGDGGKKPVEGEVFPSGAQSELLKETTTQNGSWSTQAAESKNEKDLQKSSESKQKSEHSWKICNVTAGPDYIPCLDNVKAIKKLKTTKHYEHRERHCPLESPTCLVAITEGYQRPIQWPASREKIWYNNVPHTRLAEYKGHQNWVKVSGEFITFPGGGTQFQHGAMHYIEFIEKTVPEVKWGKRSRVVLDVGCGVASFGGYLFDKDVLTMSFAPKDEHEAQVQFALERGIPAISAVMGTQRLPFPAMVFDVVHCARCRVPWHNDGGKLLLELNRLLRPGGFFVWSATPVYQKLDEDLQIWNSMTKLTKSLCWDLVSVNKDKINKVGVAIYRKPSSNECYLKRSQAIPPFCQKIDDPNAAWGVQLQSCLHKVPEDDAVRGSKWPEQWPSRLENPPYWLSSSQMGVYGKPVPEDFKSDYDHWKRVVNKSYLNGMGISWSSVRNVMDMRAVYGGFAAALRDLNVWVMNVVSVESPDTLPIIYDRGLFGIYHDWCESFSTYPRTYDLLHADHLFSMVKKKCDVVGLVAEVDRMLRPEGKLIARDNIEVIDELEKLLRSLHWEIRLTYSKKDEALLCAQKGFWRPTEMLM